MANTVHRQTEHDPHDYDPHAHGAGGHEIDSMPNRRLFNLLGGLSVLVIAACIAVIQLFNQQVAGLEAAYIEQGFQSRDEYQKAQRQILEGSGVVKVREDTGEETQRFYVPLANVVKDIAANPDRLAAASRYSGWERTDTYKAIEQLEQQGAAAAGHQPTPETESDDATMQPPGAASAPPPAGRPDGMGETVQEPELQEGGAQADDEGAGPSPGGQLPPPKGTAPTPGAAPAEVPPTAGSQPNEPDGELPRPREQVKGKE